MKATSSILLVLSLALLGGCAISQEEEISMGRDVAPQFEREFGGLYPDQAVQNYVSGVGDRLVNYSGRTDLPWHFRVLDSDQINAFALPGGQIYITKGLLFRLQDEAQLAGILGHEIAHVSQRHTVEQLEREQLFQGGLTVASVLTGAGSVADIGQLVGGLVMMRYSRDQEREADLIGLDYLVRGGYDPQALPQALRIIERTAGGKGPPEFLSTHPSSEGRIEALDEKINTTYSGIISGGRTGAREFQSIVPATPPRPRRAR